MDSRQTRLVSISRRQALRFFLGAIAGVAFFKLMPPRASAAPAGINKSLLEAPVHNLVVSATTPEQALNSLRYHFHIPFSFIQSAKERHSALIKMDIAEGTVGETLKELLAQSTGYRMLEVKGRVIVLPDRPEFDTVLKNVSIVDVPRIRAADQYLELLRAQGHSFSDWVGTSMKGDPTSPVYTAPVTLSKEAPIAQHLAELLGKDPWLSFSIEKTKSGKFVLLLHRTPK